MELPAFDPLPDASVWEAKPLDLVVRDEVEAPLGDAHDLRINRAHVGHGTSAGCHNTPRTAGHHAVRAPHMADPRTFRAGATNVGASAESRRTASHAQFS